MKIPKADFSRRIDLPGVGPAPRPVDIDQSVTGFSDLVSLRIYSFSPGAPINGEAEGDEVAIVVLDGRCEIAVTGEVAETFVLTAGSGPRAIYLPPEHHYRLTPLTPVDVAYARARSARRAAPRAFSGVPLRDEDYFETLRFSLRSVPAGESLAIETRPDTTPERLAFVRSASPVGLTTAGGVHSLESWDVAALGPGETADLTPNADALVLVVSAR